MEEYNNLTGAEWTSLGGNAFGGISSFFSSKENRKGLEAQANALRAKGLSEVEVARLMLEAEKVKAEAMKSGGAKTGAGSSALYIGLGVGAVVILGVVIFAVTRKKA